MCDQNELKQIVSVINGESGTASIYVSRDGNALDICLDTSVNYYGDWIKGEGGDISLYRDQENDKVAGAHLPLHAQKLVIAGDNIPCITIDLTTGKVEVENAECQ